MSIIDRLLVGKVLKGFGTYYEKSLGIGRENHNTLLVGSNGRYWFVVKSSVLAVLEASVSYQIIPLERAASIRDQLTECEQTVKNLPPLEYDASKPAFRYSMTTFIVASAINLLARDSGLVFLTTLIVAFVHLVLFASCLKNSGVSLRPEVRSSLRRGRFSRRSNLAPARQGIFETGSRTLAETALSAPSLESLFIWKWQTPLLMSVDQPKP